MAIRKVGNIYEGKGGLRKVGNIYADPEHQEREEKKQAIIKENLDKAEKYYQEAEDASSILGLAKNTAKGLFSGDTYSRIGKQIVQNPVNTVKSVGTGLYEGSVKPVAELLTPKKYEGIYDIGYKPKNDVEQSIQSGFGFAGAVAPYAALSKGIQLAANAPKIVNATQNIPILGKAVSILGKSEIARDFTSGIVGGQILTDAQDAKGRAEQFGLDVILEGIMAGLSRGMVRVGKINKKEVSETINDVSDIRGERPTAEQERKIEEAFLNGATKEEIVDEVGKAKIVEGIENPQPRLAEVVDQLEADGRKLSVEETMTVKTELEAGKSIDDIKAKLDNPVESPETALKSPTRAETPETVPKAAENSDEAFLKAVEERFKASKTNKFREATRDEKGQFTGSRKGITGDAERDELAQAIQNRIDAITDDSIPSFSAREDLRAIQEQVARAKTDDLARLKIESDRIADEFIKQRAAKIAPRIDKEKKIAAVRTIASESDNFNEFQLNLKRRGEDITTIFKSKAAAEEFFRKNSGQKFRVAENPLLQEIRSGKYKSAEEFVKAQGDTFYHGGTPIKEVGNMRSRWKAFYMSENPTYAKSYGGNGSSLNEMVLSKGAKMADLRKPSEELIAQLDQATKGRTTGKTFNIQKPDGSTVGVPEVIDRPDFGAYTQKQVIEGIRQGKAHFAEEPAIKEALKKLGYDGIITQESKFGANYGVWNKNVVKTKSQLTDLWKKANQSAPEQSLLSEARKYKSAKALWDLERNASKYKTAQEFEDNVLQPALATDAGKKYADVGFRLDVADINEISPSYSLQEYEMSTVKSMAKSIKSGKEIPPIIISKDGSIIDGNHRYEAYKLLGKDEIPVLIEDATAKRGTVKNAEEFFSNATGNKSQLTDLWKKAHGEKFRAEPISKSLADETEAGYQVRAEMENSTAGRREVIGEGMDREVVGIPSTFPKWVSTEYRSTDLFEKVLEHIDNGTVPKSSRQLGLYNEARDEMQKRAARFGERFEELTGTKLTPEQEAKIKELHKKMFGDDGIEITAQILTPEGQKAFGVYKNKVIKILDGQADPTDTLYHESVHKYLDLFTTLDEQKKIYVEARKLWKTDNLDELEEKIAENFIRYAKTNEGVVGTMKVIFDKVIDRIKTAISGESSIEALYKDILEGKAKKVKEVKIASVEPKKTVEKPLAQQTEQVKPKTSVIASRLNEALPDGMKIDETYEPKVIKEELDKAANAIGKDKEKAIQKAFDPNTNPVERDAILIELSEIAKRDGDYAAMADLFQRRTELIRSGAQSLNMEKASILLNPQEKYMRDIVNARLSKVKVNGKDLTDVEVASIRKSVRKETSEAAKKAFKIQDAQELFNSLIC